MSFEDKVKSSFERVKEEISALKFELQNLRLELNELKSLKEELKAIKEEFSTRNQPHIKPNFITPFSIGNEGVPTNQQTNRSTINTPSFPVDGDSPIESNTSTHIPTQNPTHLQHITEKLQQSNTKSNTSSSKINEFKDLNALIETLKTDLKKKFKSLTKQEFHIFSILYSVDKTQNNGVSYQDLAIRAGLTPSSIRDYTQRIIKKGIPLIKERQNNKLIVLKLPLELKNLATLDSLMRLRNDFPDENLDSFTKN